MSSEEKNRPNWRCRLGQGPPKGFDTSFKGYRSRFGDNHPNRKRCIAVARSTGKPCRNDAVRGASCCNMHGGMRWGRVAEEKRLGIGRVISLTAGRSARRQALAKRGSEEKIPDGLPCPISPIDRGLILEAWENRLTAPEIWLSITERFGLKVI